MVEAATKRRVAGSPRLSSGIRCPPGTASGLFGTVPFELDNGKAMEKTRGEHAIAVVKAGISAVPLVGGTIASLLSDYVPTATQRSIKEAITMLRDELTRLGKRVDTESLDKDEFSELFKSSYQTIVRTHQEDKLRAAMNVVANILLREGDSEKLLFAELDHFSRCLELLSTAALKTLGDVRKLVAKIADFPSNQDSSRQLSFEQLKAVSEVSDPDLLMGLLGELHAMNLIHSLGSPSIAQPRYSNYAFRMTQLGRRCVEYLLRPERPGV